MSIMLPATEECIYFFNLFILWWLNFFGFLPMILTYDASMVKGNQGYQNLEANKLLCASTESKKYNKNTTRTES